MHKGEREEEGIFAQSLWSNQYHLGHGVDRVAGSVVRERHQEACSNAQSNVVRTQQAPKPAKSGQHTVHLRRSSVALFTASLSAFQHRIYPITPMACPRGACCHMQRAPTCQPAVNSRPALVFNPLRLQSDRVVRTNAASADAGEAS